MVTLLSRFDLKNRDFADEIRSALLDLSDRVRSEPGHVSYQAFSSDEEPPVLWVLESWNSQEDADRHGRRVVTEGIADRAASSLSGPIVTSILAPL